MKRITVKITKNIYYFFRYAYRFNLQIHTQVAPAREGGPPRPQTPRRPRSAPSAGAGWSGRRDRPHGGAEESETPGKDGPGGNGPEEIRRKRQQDPEFFVIFGSYGRSLLPYSLLQARLRLLRLLQERRTGPHGAARGGDAPRTRSAPRLSGRRTCPHALFRGRHAVALSAGDDRRAAGPCRGACSTARPSRRRPSKPTPDDLTPAYLEALRRTGIDRLSIGIQSFDDACLKLMNRRHTAAQAAESVRRAREAGFGNLTIDLIFGVPGFGGDTLRRSLDTALALGPEHISAYHLTIEPATTFRTPRAGRLRAGGGGGQRSGVRPRARYAHRRGIRTLRGLEFRPPGIPRPPQRRILARREVSGHRPPPPTRSTGGNVTGTSLPLRNTSGAPNPEAKHFPNGTASTNTSSRGCAPPKESASPRPKRCSGRNGPRGSSGRSARGRRRARPRSAGGRLAVPPRRMLLSDAVIETLFET